MQIVYTVLSIKSSLKDKKYVDAVFEMKKSLSNGYITLHVVGEDDYNIYYVNRA